MYPLSNPVLFVPGLLLWCPCPSVSNIPWQPLLWGALLRLALVVSGEGGDQAVGGNVAAVYGCQ
jgi:hypothetical protein